MANIVKLKAGETVLVAAVRSGEKPDQGLPGGGQKPVDPGYGIDAGLGWLRPTHPIAHSEHPDNSLPLPELPPEGPVDPSWGIDVDIGYVRPDNSLPKPQPPVIPGPGWEIKTAWTPMTGWIVVAIPTGPHVTPSAKPTPTAQPKR